MVLQFKVAFLLIPYNISVRHDSFCNKLAVVHFKSVHFIHNMISTNKWPYDTKQCLLRAKPFTVLGE